MASSLVLAMWIFYSVLFLVIYHKIFSVMYFNLLNGIYREFIVAVLTGAIMTGITLWFWQIAVVVILIIGFVVSNSPGNPLGRAPVLVIFIILAVVIGIMGYKVRSAGEKSQDAVTTEEQIQTEQSDEYDSGYSSSDSYNVSGYDSSGVYENSDDETNSFYGDSYSDDNNLENEREDVQENSSNNTSEDDMIESDFDSQWYKFYPNYTHENGEHGLSVDEEEDGRLYVAIDGNIITHIDSSTGEEVGHERYMYTCDDGSLMTVCYGDGYKVYFESVNGGDEQGLYYPIDGVSYSQDTDDYILDGSDSRYISEDEIQNLTSAEIRLAKNEIYARHGRIFDSTDLRQYFESKSWYHGEIEPEDFDESVFNEYEKANIDLLVSYE